MTGHLLVPDLEVAQFGEIVGIIACLFVLPLGI